MFEILKVKLEKKKKALINKRLDFCHSKGIMHRDETYNIMIDQIN